MGSTGCHAKEWLPCITCINRLILGSLLHYVELILSIFSVQVHTIENRTNHGITFKTILNNRYVTPFQTCADASCPCSLHVILSKQTDSWRPRNKFEESLHYSPVGFISTLSSTGDVEDLRKQTAFSEMLEGLSEEKRREERLKLSRTWGVGWLEKSLVGNMLKPQLSYIFRILEGGTYHAVKICGFTPWKIWFPFTNNRLREMGKMEFLERSGQTNLHPFRKEKQVEASSSRLIEHIVYIGTFDQPFQSSIRWETMENYI